MSLIVPHCWNRAARRDPLMLGGGSTPAHRMDVDEYVERLRGAQLRGFQNLRRRGSGAIDVFTGRLPPLTWNQKKRLARRRAQRLADLPTAPTVLTRSSKADEREARKQRLAAVVVAGAEQA